VFPGPALAISGCPINDCPEDARRHGNLCKPLQLVQGRSDAVTVGPAHTFLTAPKGGERNAFRWLKGASQPAQCSIAFTVSQFSFCYCPPPMSLLDQEAATH
jgi:hypothetical protein